jgi:RNA polymerase sigma-70 factor (ECF subfamily)
MLPAPHHDDVKLLGDVVAGDSNAVRMLLDSAGDVLYGFVFARVGGDSAAAEDIVQETFLEAVRSAHTFRGDASLRTWLCAIARRRLARHYEAERRHEVVQSGLRLVEGGLAEAIGADHGVDQRDEVVRALGALSPLHRQVLVLKYLDERSVEEIAAEVGRTRVQVQSLLQRARAGLRRELEEGHG